jgi:endo-1,4-beta-D-glucanase Y
VKKLIAAFLLFAVICYIGCYLTLLNAPLATVYKDENLKKLFYRKKEDDLYNFIENNFIGKDGGVYTKIKSSSNDNATLAESVGILMNYYLLKGEKDLFDKELNFLKDNLLTRDNFIKWKTGANITCNAAIDDLRIIRVLMDAYDEWKDEEYFNIAGFVQERIYNVQVKNGCLAEFYDWKKNTTKDSVPLCYLDSYTMDRLKVFNNNWSKVAERALTIIKNGRINTVSPFFKKYYIPEATLYKEDEEYSVSGGICLTYTLYTVIHLAEMNEDTGFFAAWLKNEIAKGRLYAWYNPATMKPVKELESTAVYALAAIYSKKTGEDELYEKLVKRMLQFSVTDEKSECFGGFGDEGAEGFYSFDNLTALLALAMAAR